MRSHFAFRAGPTLIKAPTWRQQAGRRRLMVACAFLGLALVSGLIGSLTHHPGAVLANAHVGPFSYFPSE